MFVRTCIYKHQTLYLRDSPSCKMKTISANQCLVKFPSNLTRTKTSFPKAHPSIKQTKSVLNQWFSNCSTQSTAAFTLFTRSRNFSHFDYNLNYSYLNVCSPSYGLRRLGKTTIWTLWYCFLLLCPHCVLWQTQVFTDFDYGKKDKKK